MTGSDWTVALGTDHAEAGYRRLTGDTDPEINNDAEGDETDDDCNGVTK